MCLEKLQKFTTNPKKVGYKIFIKETQGGYMGMNYHHHHKPYQLGCSYTAKTTGAKNGMINTNEFDKKNNRYVKYKAGFHVYDKLSTAKKEYYGCNPDYKKIVEVKYNKKDILATGLNYGHTVILKKMTLVREVK